AFQLTYFDFAIPEEIKNVWAEGLQSGDKIFKLCGAGGGGFMICFSVKN
ncbi:MAG: mevalonate kinase, partial [Chitinophagales bacterium]|nr:mevalonate kinase [Chitinophagales bacterium]